MRQATLSRLFHQIEHIHIIPTQLIILYFGSTPAGGGFVKSIKPVPLMYVVVPSGLRADSDAVLFCDTRVDD
jgi:hypothetical protein